MVVATTTYLYVDTNLTQYFVQGTELVDMGPWSSATFYNPNEVVQIGVDQYICLTANSNTPPTGIVDENWSTLVVVEEQSGSIVTSGSDYYARFLADAAFDLAVYGTYLGTQAYNLASAAYSIGTNAYALAQSAFAVGADAYNLAVSGTNLGWSAYLLAQTGTNAASAAQNTASAAYLLAQAGTNAGISAQNTADAAYALAQIGTNTGTAAYSYADTAYNYASAAYMLAELGTVVPALSDLTDVSIPAPVSNQVLGYNGSVWVAMDTPSQVAPGAFTLYLEDTPSGTAGYDTLLSEPSGLPEDADARIVGDTDPFVAIEGYLGNPVQRTILDGGIWEFSTYASVSSASAQLVIEVYTRSIAGVETFLFSGTTAAVVDTSPALVGLISTQGSYATALTDRLVAKYYWQRTSAPAITATTYHSGSTHASHIHTPIGFAHNDLSGLQGGSSGQFYHLTLDELDAVRYAAVTPQQSNPFVTEAQLATEQGTRSAADQNLQNQIDNFSVLVTLAEGPPTVLDFTATGYRAVALTTDGSFITTNLTPVNALAVRVSSGGATRSLSFPASWTWIGDPAPTTLDSNKIALLSVTSFGSADSAVIAGWAAEQ